MRIIIVYYSRSGSVKKMAEIIGRFIEGEGENVRIAFIEDISARDLLDYDGIIVGSPTYYGSMAAEVKKLFDETVAFHGKLDGKVGGAFSSSANIAGGNESTVLSILEAMLIHGMIIQGDWQGDHYGPVAIEKVDKRCEAVCRRFAKRFVALLKKTAG